MIVEEAAAVSPPSLNVSVYAPLGALSARALKVATPATATAVLCRAAYELDVMLAVTVEVLVVTMLPPESSIFTTGCWASATLFATVDEGWVVMTS